MKFPRSSGILLHPTSLPGRFGIGDFGPSADAFLDFLSETGQAWWQILPLGPTGYGNSPYQSHSSYAGNRLLISPRLAGPNAASQVRALRRNAAIEQGIALGVLVCVAFLGMGEPPG